MALPLDHVLAKNIRALREAHGWRQADLAEQAAAQGLAWTANRVAQVETLRRKLDLIELAGLCWLFGCSLETLLEGDETVELPAPNQTVPLRRVRAALLKGGSAERPATTTAVAAYVPSEEARKIAGRLGVPAIEIDRYAERTYGRSLPAERDRRAGDVSAMPKRSAQARRGHVMRALIAEVEQGMRAEKDAKVRYLKRLQVTREQTEGPAE